MSVSGYINSFFYRFTVEHAIVGRVLISAVVGPKNAARVMIGIKTFVAVVISYTVFTSCIGMISGALGLSLMP